METAGILDRILMGVGTSRGRRSDNTLRVNDVIDFWRVEAMECDKMLLLRAEMKLPGKAWLRFDIEEKEDKNIFSVTAFFSVQSIWGRLYWYNFLPFHHFIFLDLLRQIEKRS